jgi:hypothetical protein
MAWQTFLAALVVVEQAAALVSTVALAELIPEAEAEAVIIVDLMYQALAALE